MTLFLGNRDLRRAAAQQVIEAQTFMARAEAALRIVRKAIAPGRLIEATRVSNEIAFLSKEVDQLDHLFNVACQEAFTEESDGSKD